MLKLINKQMSMRIPINYRFFMEFFRFARITYELLTMLEEITGDKVIAKKSMIIMNLIIEAKKFDEKFIEKNQEIFNHLLAFLCSMFEEHFDNLQEKFNYAMERCEIGVEEGKLCENSYLSSCKVLKMLYEYGKLIKDCLDIADPNGFIIENENQLILIMERKH